LLFCWPSGYDLDNIISVAVTDNKDMKASFSSYGKETVDLGAPGYVNKIIVIYNSLISKKIQTTKF